MATTQYMWLIQNGHSWKEMDAWEQKILEQSIADGEFVVELGIYPYQWDLLTMLQANQWLVEAFSDWLNFLELQLEFFSIAV